MVDVNSGMLKLGYAFNGKKNVCVYMCVFVHFVPACLREMKLDRY